MIWKQRRPGDKGHTVTIEPVTQFVDGPDDGEEPEVMGGTVRVNVRLLLITFVVLIVAVTGIHFLHGFWVQRNADTLLDRADAAEAEERYSDAISALTQYLNLQPQTALSDDDEQQITDVLERLAGLVQMQDITRNQQLRLFRTFEEILRRDPTRQETRRQLVDVCMRLALYRDAMRHIDTLLDQPAAGEPEADKTTSELLLLKGDCLQALENYRSAAIAYVQSIAADPTSPDGYARVVALASEHPAEMPSKQEINGLSGKTVPEVAAAFPASTDSRSTWGVTTPLALLSQMIAVAEPAWRTHLLKSQFLLSMASRNDAPALDEANASRRAADIFTERDANEDGVLDAVEANHESVPTLTDANDDGQIDRSELVSRLMLGDRLAHLRAALSSALEAVAFAETSDSPAALTRTLRNAADVNLALANAAMIEADDDPEAYRTAARELLERALKTDHADPQIYLSLARLERQHIVAGMQKEDIRRHLEISEQHLRDGLEQVRKLSEAAEAVDRNDEDREPDNDAEAPINTDAAETELLWNLADTLVALSQFSDNKEELLTEVREMIPRLEEIGTREMLTDFLEAQLLMAREQWHPALGILTQLSTMKLSGALGRRVALLRSRCMQELEIPDSAVNLFAGQVQQDPLWIDGRIELARAMVASGQMQRAIDEYRRIVNAPGVPESLARLLLVQQSSLPANRRNISDIERVIALIPEDSGPQRALLTAELQLLRARTLAQNAKQDETDADKLTRREQAIAELDAASTTLQDAIADHPDDADLRAAYATLLLRRFDRPIADRLAAAERYLQEAVEDLGDQVPFRLTAIQASIALPRDEALASLTELETDLQKFSREDQQSLRSGLARGYATIGDFDRAIAHWQAIAETDPHALQPRLAILQLMIAARQQSDVDITAGDDVWNATLAEVREIETATDGNDTDDSPAASTGAAAIAPNASYFEAARLILDAAEHQEEKEAKLERARTLLERAARERPMWSAIPRALGDIEVMLGNRALAVEHYEKAFSLGDRTPRMIGRIAQYHFSQLTPEGIERAGRLMDELRAENPNLITDELSQLQWKIDWRRSQFEDALGVLEALANRSDNLNDRLRWLWAQLLTGRQSENIEQLIEELADEHGATSPEVWQLWVAYLVRGGRMDEAIDVIEQAKKRLPDEPPHLKPLAIAGYLELLRFNDAEQLKKYRAEAERYYRLALEAAPDSTTVALPLARFYIGTEQFDKARPLLDGILASPEAPEPARDWARRNKALIIASSGRYDDTTRALELLSTATDDDNLSASDLRAQLAILTRRSARSDRPKRIEILEQLAATDQLSEREQFQLAKLYEAAGDWKAARQLFEELLDERRNDRTVVAEFALAAIRNDEFDLAAALANRLDEIAPDTLLAASTRARLLSARDEKTAAVLVLREYLNNLTRPDDNAANPELRTRLRKVASEGPGQVASLLDLFEEYLESADKPEGRKVLSQARRLAEDGKPEEAFLTALRFLINNDLTIALYVDQLRVVATLLEEIGQADAAAPLYEEYVRMATRPEALLLYAAYLGRQDQPQEAFQLLEQAWGQLDHSQILRYAVALNRRGGLSEENVNRIRQWLQQARKEQPGSPLVLLYWADFADSLGDYSTEEKLYRQIIAEHPERSVIAMNNLAYLLAVGSQKTEEADQLLAQAIGIAGPDPVLLETRAVIGIHKNDFQAAVADLRRSIDLQPTSMNQFLLACALAGAGDVPAAREMYDRALADGFTPDELHPLDRPLYEKLQEQLNLQASR